MIAVIKSLLNRIQAWRTWDTDPAQAWYYTGPWTGRWFGNLRFHRAASIVYILVAVILPVAELCAAKNPTDFLGWLADHPVTAVIWLAFVTLALPLFIWYEQLAFDNWIATITDPKQRKKITARFKINAKHMETFWKTVAGLYLTAGLFSFASDRRNPANPPTQKDIKALTRAVNNLAAVGTKKLPPVKAGNESSNEDYKSKHEEQSAKTQKPIDVKVSEPFKTEEAKPSALVPPKP